MLSHSADMLNSTAPVKYLQHKNLYCCVVLCSVLLCSILQVWDARSHQLLQHYPAHDSEVTSISFHNSGNFLLSSSTDSSLKVCIFFFVSNSVIGSQIILCGIVIDERENIKDPIFSGKKILPMA